MGKKGGGKHIKRKPAPRFWPLHRKELVWTIKPRPGPHPVSDCIPLLLVIRDVLDLAETRKEAKTVISQGKIEIDGKIRRDERFPIGLMDVLSIPSLEERYRVLPSESGLTLHNVDSEEAGFKLCRIEDKHTVKGGHLQLNLHDGRNLLVELEEAKSPEEDIYQTLDVLKMSIPDREILEHSSLAEKKAALIVGGKNVGRHGTIVDIEDRPGQERRSLLATIEDPDGNRFQTVIDLVFPLGDETTWISLPESERVV